MHPGRNPAFRTSGYLPGSARMQGQKSFPPPTGICLKSMETDYHHQFGNCPGLPGIIRMTPHLQACLDQAKAPFNGWCVHNREPLSLSQLHTLLECAFPRLQALDPKLFAFADWHEHDGFVLETRETTWPAILSNTASIQALFASRNDNYYVRNAFHDQNHQWLLRYHIGEDTYEEDDCDFDLSAAPGSPWEQVANDLLQQFPAWLTRTTAQTWFLARGC